MEKYPVILIHCSLGSPLTNTSVEALASATEDVLLGLFYFPLSYQPAKLSHSGHRRTFSASLPGEGLE